VAEPVATRYAPRSPFVIVGAAVHRSTSTIMPPHAVDVESQTRPIEAASRVDDR
jgi:hypothetical protein